MTFLRLLRLCSSSQCPLLSCCPAYTSCLATGQSALLLNQSKGALAKTHIYTVQISHNSIMLNQPLTIRLVCGATIKMPLNMNTFLHKSSVSSRFIYSYYCGNSILLKCLRLQWTVCNKELYDLLCDSHWNKMFI